ncbi:universal stress protein [Chloroflexota bacterium]
MYEKIVVPLDGSELAKSALPYAEELAAGMGSDIILFSVLDSEEADARQKHQDYIERVTGAIEKRAARRAGDSGDKQIKVGTASRSGDAAEGIVSYANRGSGSKMVVMATHGRSGISRWALGSVADKVVRTSIRQPLLLIRANETSPPANGRGILHKALIPLDGSVASETVLPYISGLVAKFKMEITLLQVVSPDEPDDLDAGDYLANTCRLLREDGITAEHVIKEGSAADEIIKLADELSVNMVAMSTHGRSGISRWMLGSVAQKVLLGGNKPLLLLRG